MSDEAPAKRGRGRPKGSFNRSSKAQIAEVTKDGGMTPLQYLASVYQNPAEDTKIRVDAAGKAAPYCHSKLASIELSGTLTELTHEQWLEALR